MHENVRIKLSISYAKLKISFTIVEVGGWCFRRREGPVGEEGGKGE